MDTTPQIQKYKQTVLDPDTLSQVLGGSSSAQIADPTTAAITQAQMQAQVLNSLQQYKSSQDSVQKYGPAPQGMSQAAWAGLCEAWQEKQAYGHTGIYPSAIAAANDYAQKGLLNPNLAKAQPGDLVFFSANQGNGNLGHTGILQSNGMFRSATDNGVQDNDLQAWQKATGQKMLGFVHLGK